jgi:hypothetical protein
MRLLISRVRHVTITRPRERDAQFALPTTLTASDVIFTEESWVRNTLSVSI